MKALIAALDYELHGRRAAVVAFGFAFLVFWLAIWPLPWRFLPDLQRFLSSSWLTILFRGMAIYYAMTNIASRRESLVGMISWFSGGLGWKLFAPFIPLPFNFSRLMMIYGAAGIMAHFIRKSFTKGPLPAEPAPNPIPPA